MTVNKYKHNTTSELVDVAMSESFLIDNYNRIIMMYVKVTKEGGEDYYLPLDDFNAEYSPELHTEKTQTEDAVDQVKE